MKRVVAYILTKCEFILFRHARTSRTPFIFFSFPCFAILKCRVFLHVLAMSSLCGFGKDNVYAKYADIFLWTK